MRKPPCLISCSHPGPDRRGSAREGRQGGICPTGRRLCPRNKAMRLIKPLDTESRSVVLFEIWVGFPDVGCWVCGPAVFAGEGFLGSSNVRPQWRAPLRPLFVERTDFFNLQPNAP